MSENGSNGNGQKLERLANNAVLVVAQRISGAILIPVLVAAVLWVGNSLVDLKVSVAELKGSFGEMSRRISRLEDGR